jgi:hypothetical protein
MCPRHEYQCFSIVALTFAKVPFASIRDCRVKTYAGLYNTMNQQHLQTPEATPRGAA